MRAPNLFRAPDVV